MLVELMGGKIWVESPNPNFMWSTENPGSVFHFSLPFEIEKNQIYHDFDQDIFIKVNALVVDNHKTNLLLLKKTLTNWGITSNSVYDEKSALEWLSNNPDVNLVIIDSHVFSLNDSSFSKAIKHNHPQVRIVLFTSENRWKSSEVDKAVDKVLHKPIKHTELFKAIENLFVS